MSPEQARGRHIDKRSDVWSFGVLLYEMLTGASPFAGETATDSIGAVLHKDIDLSRLPRETPDGVRHVLWRCLQRGRDARYRDIGDVLVELRGALAHEEEPWRVGAGQATPRRTVAIIVTTAVCAAAATGGLVWLLRPAAESMAAPMIAHFSVTHHEGGSQVYSIRPTLSSDGRRLVLRGVVDGELNLFVRDFDDPVMREIPNTRRASDFGVSPDGRWVYFRQDSVLKRRRSTADRV